MFAGEKADFCQCNKYALDEYASAYYKKYLGADLRIMAGASLLGGLRGLKAFK